MSVYFRNRSKVCGHRAKHDRNPFLFFPAMILCGLLLLESSIFPASAATSGVFSVAQYPSGKDGAGMSSTLASFPGLSLGGARIEKDSILLSFDCAGADSVVTLNGRAMRFEVKAGQGNSGTFCILLDEDCLAESFGSDRLLLKWKRSMPQAGAKIHVGEAVLALPRQPSTLPITAA